MKCDDCYHYIGGGGDDGKGRCYRFPPVLARPAEEHEYPLDMWVRPQVMATSPACGEYKEAGL